MQKLHILERVARAQLRETSDAINLIAREGRAEDVARCYALQEPLWLPNAEACRRVLAEMWHALLSDGRMQLFLVENRAKPLGSRIVSFSATVFATDEFCCEALSTLPPYLGLQVARHYLSRELPVMNSGQVAHANAGCGLNVLLCFGGWESIGLSREEILAVREKQSEALHLALSGYRVKEFLADAIGEEALQWMRHFGARLRRDYSRYFAKQIAPIPEMSQRPRLVGLTKEEALANPGSHLSSLFVYIPPRFHFNQSEQMLLQHALIGETSEELAKSLFVSHSTVKKRWHRIYERVADVDCELLGAPVANGLDATKRGAEHRRHLLHYLRQHLEELRPFSRGR